MAHSDGRRKWHAGSGGGSGKQGREEGVAPSDGRREWHPMTGGGSGTQGREEGVAPSDGRREWHAGSDRLTDIGVEF